MIALSDEQIYYLGCEAIALIAGGLALLFLVRRMGTSRAGLAIGVPIAVAFGLRLVAAVALELTSVASELRGGDEFTFLIRAETVAKEGLASTSGTDALTSELHVFSFAIFDSFLDPVPEFMLRVLVIVVAVAGIACLAAGVWELAGPRAAALAAWVVALEPTHIFFSGILHKEPFMFLAEGLLVLGGARLWRGGQLGGIVPLALGCLIAIATRPYVGYFFLAAAAVVVLHASFRHRRAARSTVLIAVSALLIGVFVPFAYDNSSNEKLASLQKSQDANARNTAASLSFEAIDYSTREDLILNLPQRMWDVVSRPYPWELRNTSQRLGLIGTLVMLGGFMLLFSDVIRRGGRVLQSAAPVIYPAMFALVAYSLSAGNAGTAYRYRTHVVALMLCTLVAVRAPRSERRAEPADAPAAPRATPVPAPATAVVAPAAAVVPPATPAVAPATPAMKPPARPPRGVPDDFPPPEPRFRVCPVCRWRADNATVLHEERLDPSRLGNFMFATSRAPELLRWRLVECGACGLAFADPAPSADVLAAARSDRPHSREQSRYAAAAHGRLVSGLLPRLPSGGGALDIGAGDGAFLEILSRLGFDAVEGVEASRAALDAADPRVRPLIREGEFSAQDFGAGSFRLVSCLRKIEHLREPLTAVRDAYDLLCAGGALVVVCHDRTARVNRMLGLRAPIWDIEHLQLLSPQSLRELLEQAGFADIEISPFSSTYPLRHWARHAPLPAAAKESTVAAMGRRRLAQAPPLTVRAGDLAAVAWRR